VTRRYAVPLALGGVAAVAVAVEQALLTVPAGYEATVTTGWGGPLNHEEVLLRRVAAVGLVGAVAATRRRAASALPAVAGAVVLGYTGRAVAHYAGEPGFYRETTTLGGEPLGFVLGPEAFLLAAGGLLLVAAAAVGWRAGRAADGAGPVGESPAA
jgi:hypothetical protein